jgi:hypothetical protein
VSSQAARTSHCLLFDGLAGPLCASSSQITSLLQCD